MCVILLQRSGMVCLTNLPTPTERSVRPRLRSPSSRARLWHHRWVCRVKSRQINRNSQFNSYFLDKQSSYKIHSLFKTFQCYVVVYTEKIDRGEGSFTEADWPVEQRSEWQNTTAIQCQKRTGTCNIFSLCFVFLKVLKDKCALVIDFFWKKSMIWTLKSGFGKINHSEIILA